MLMENPMHDLIQTLEVVYVPFVVLLSLIVGSFLNVVIHRLPKMMESEWQREASELLNVPPPTDEKITLSSPSSSCPRCNRAIRWYENIPVLSYLFILRAHCAGCHSFIPLRYPIVEVLSALIGWFVAVHFGFSLQMLAFLILSYGLIALVFIDVDHQLLPDQITLPLLWLGLIVHLLLGAVPLDNAVLGAAIGYLLLWSVFWLFKLLTGKEGMGYGDFKLLAALGAWGGFTVLPGILLISSVLGVLYALVSTLMVKRDLNTAIPFGPFLALAGWVMLIWGQSLNHWYLSLL